MKITYSSQFTSILLGLAFIASTLPTHAQLIPVKVTGFNIDIIANGGDGTGNSVDATASTLDSADGLYVYYTQGFLTASPTVGLPTTGFVSAKDSKTTFQLQPPEGDNALLLKPLASGSLTFSSPSKFTNLALLVTGFHGDISVSYKISYSDATSDAGEFIANDNFDKEGFAIRGFGRVGRGSDYVQTPQDNPRLYQVTLTGFSTSKTINSIEFTNSTNVINEQNEDQNIAIFAVSATP